MKVDKICSIHTRQHISYTEILVCTALLTPWNTIIPTCVFLCIVESNIEYHKQKTHIPNRTRLVGKKKLYFRVAIMNQLWKIIVLIQCSDMDTQI